MADPCRQNRQRKPALQRRAEEPERLYRLVAGAAGGMWGFFFADSSPRNRAQAGKADHERYGRCFHAMLAQVTV